MIGDEEQILVWDICNEPMAYNGDFPMKETVMKYELEWLQHCGCADLHGPEDGRLTPNIGNLCFINKDGSMRPYHEVFNEF